MASVIAAPILAAIGVVGVDANLVAGAILLISVSMWGFHALKRAL